jgi:hypothetical protein
MNEERALTAVSIAGRAALRCCAGKQCFPSKKNATARVRTLPQDPNRGPWGAYKCPNCHRWHIGHSRVWTEFPPGREQEWREQD